MHSTWRWGVVHVSDSCQQRSSFAPRAGRTETEVVAVDVRTIGPNSDPQHSIHPRRNTPRALVNELPDGH